MDDSIDSGSFSARGYLPLVQKDSVAHMHVLAVYVKEGLIFAWHLFLENSVHSYSCFQLVLLSALLRFCLSSIFLSLCSLFNDLIPCNINEVLSMNPSANAFVFGDFSIYHNNWLTYSGGTDRPAELL